MRVLILTKTVEPQGYNYKRFREVGEDEGIDLFFGVAEDFSLSIEDTGLNIIKYKGETFELPDCVIPRMSMGFYYPAIALIRHFISLNIPVINSDEAIISSNDKFYTFQRLANSRIPMPKTILLTKKNLEVIDTEFSYPLVIKSIEGTKGECVILCKSKKEIIDFMKNNESEYFLAQEYIRSSKGKDLRVFIIGKKVIGAILRESKKGIFQTNFSAGGKVTRFEINQEIVDLSLDIINSLNLDIAGVDLLFDEKGYKLCEVNASPGFEGFEKATGINVPKQIFDYAKELCK